jgi:DNA-binding transcriptional regulator YhcF (GntR family)
MFSTISNANEVAKIYQHLQQQNGLNKKKISFLFVQKAGLINLSKQKKHCYSMQLSQLGESLLYFSDRPSRIVGHMSTAEFVSIWNKTKIYPNATVQGFIIHNKVKNPL